MRKTGRPKTSKLTRAEQLQRAKRRQRGRQRAAGIVQVQLAVPQALAERIALVRRMGMLVPVLEEALERTLVRIQDFPQLTDLAWNRNAEYIPAEEAFKLYERNWRFVDPSKFIPEERRLIERLKSEYGKGLINA